MDGSFVVKGNIIWSESLSSIKSMEDIFLVVEEGKVKGVFKTLPSQYSSLSISSKPPATVEKLPKLAFTFSFTVVGFGYVLK